MNIFKIIFKEIKQDLRNKKGMVLMILFPMVLILILGAAFSNVFSTDKKTGTINILYAIEGKDQTRDSFNEFMKSVSKDMDITFKKQDNIEKGKQSIVSNKMYDCFVVINKENNVEVYKNDTYNNVSANVFVAALQQYVQTCNTVTQINKVNPAAVNQAISKKSSDNVKIQSLEEARKPNALDYYSITMLTLIIMYASNTGLYSIISENEGKTKNRLLSAPLNKYQLLVGKTLGVTIVTILQVLIVIVFSKYLLKAYWGENILIVFAIILSQIIMTVSLGVGLAFITKKSSVASGLLGVLIPIFVFLGGGYFPLDFIDNKIFKLICNLSPLKWTNDAIFKIIYSKNFSLVPSAIMINLIIAIVFLGISTLVVKLEAE